MKRQRNFILSFLLLLIASSIVAQTSSPDKQKSRYYYLEGTIQNSKGNYDAAYDLFRHAYQTDPENIDAQFTLGSLAILFNVDSLAYYKNALDMMRPAVDAHPEDYIEAQAYAYWASKLGDFDEAIRIYSTLDTLFPDKTEILISLAEMHSQKKELDKAIKYYERYETTEGKSSQISLRKIVYHLNLGDTVSAINEADSLIAYNPKEAGYYILKGDVYSFLSIPDSALASYQKAELIDPQRGEAKIALAAYYKNQNDSVSYDNKIYEALLCDDFNLNDKLSLLTEYLANLLQDKSATERGDYLFSVLRDQYPHEAPVLDLAARYSAAKGKWENAIEEISYAIDMEPTNETFWYQKMSYQISNEQYSEAIDTYNQSLPFIGKNKDMMYQLGGTYLFTNDNENAISTYTEILHSISPELTISDSITDKKLRNTFSYDELKEISFIYTIIGDVYYQDNQIDSTFKAYENAIFFFNENAMVYNNYAYFLAENGGDLEKAEAMSAKAINLEPDNPTYLDTYAWIFFKKGDYKMAKTYQEAAIEKSSDETSYEFYEHFGDILFMNGDPKGALQNWEKALKLEPNREILQRKVKHKTYFYE